MVFFVVVRDSRISHYTLLSNYFIPLTSFVLGARITHKNQFLFALLQNIVQYFIVNGIKGSMIVFFIGICQTSNIINSANCLLLVIMHQSCRSAFFKIDAIDSHYRFLKNFAIINYGHRSTCHWLTCYILFINNKLNVNG